MNRQEKIKLVVGAAIAAVVFYFTLQYFRGEELMTSPAGETVSVPGVGLASLGQIAMSVLIAIGGFALQVGGELLKKLIARFLPQASGPQTDAVIDALTQAAIALLPRTDTAGRELRAKAIAVLDAAFDDKANT